MESWVKAKGKDIQPSTNEKSSFETQSEEEKKSFFQNPQMFHRQPGCTLFPLHLPCFAVFRI